MPFRKQVVELREEAKVNKVIRRKEKAAKMRSLLDQASVFGPTIDAKANVSGKMSTVVAKEAPSQDPIKAFEKQVDRTLVMTRLQETLH